MSKFILLTVLNETKIMLKIKDIQTVKIVDYDDEVKCTCIYSSSGIVSGVTETPEEIYNLINKTSCTQPAPYQLYHKD